MMLRCTSYFQLGKAIQMYKPLNTFIYIYCIIFTFKVLLNL